MCNEYDANAWIRRKEVCQGCYKIIARDNRRRWRIGEDIPDSFDLTQKYNVINLKKIKHGG